MIRIKLPTIGQYIERVKKKKRFKTNAELARAIKVERQYLYSVLHLKLTCNDAVSARLAKVTDEDAEKVILIAHWTMANDNIKPYYEAMYQKCHYI